MCVFGPTRKVEKCFMYTPFTIIIGTLLTHGDICVTEKQQKCIPWSVVYYT